MDDEYVNTLFLTSIKNNDFKNIKYCIEHNVDINMYDSCALRISTACGYINTIKYLIKNNIKIDSKSQSLYNAIAGRYFDIGILLIENNADLNMIKLELCYVHSKTYDDFIQYLRLTKINKINEL